MLEKWKSTVAMPLPSPCQKYLSNGPIDTNQFKTHALVQNV